MLVKRHTCNLVLPLIIFRKWAIKLSYDLTTTLGTSTARNRAPVPVKTLQRDVRVTNPRGMLYTIVDASASLRLEQMYTMTLSRRIERSDEDKVKMALKQLLVLLDGNALSHFQPCYLCYCVNKIKIQEIMYSN